MKYILTFIFLACFTTAKAQSYIQETQKYQSDYRAEYLGKESPFTKDEKKKFKQTSYFPIQEKYRVEVEYKELSTKDTLIFMTSKGSEVSYIRFAELTFTIDNNTYSLFAYQNVRMSQKPDYTGWLFLPFKDLTSGESTYGGGRYLDFSIPKEEKVYIDFNKSYHPYCAYSDRFYCPLVPQENWLNVAIEAGVRL